jgi:heme/copper-type cytochrome/quinol oxidase subunit 2
MAQTCSPCSVPLCGKTVTKTRLELNAEVMMMMMMMIIIIIIIIIIITVILRKVQTKKKNTKEVRGFESASSRLLVKHYTTELPQ